MLKKILLFSLTLSLWLSLYGEKPREDDTLLAYNFAFSDCGDCVLNVDNPSIFTTSPFDPLTIMLATGASLTGSQCSNINPEAISQVWSYGDDITGTSVLHIYSQPGTYQVCVTYYVEANNEPLCSKTACSLLQIGTLSEDCDACNLNVASPSVSLASPFDPLTVVFTSGTSINASQCQVVSQIWSYGDGTTGSSNIHTYLEAGTYQVCLTYNAETNGHRLSCSEIACNSIQIGAGKNAISTIPANTSITNYPNPCTTSTTIEYQLKAEESVSLMVYDKSGRLVEALVQNERQTKGIHKQNFDTKHLPTGIYFYQLLTNTQHLSSGIIKTAAH
ncbi:MAG: PKD domain-containing protein [Chitinophagales bacterium]